MQIKIIHKMQTVLDKIIKVVKFAWRHFFSLIVLSIFILCFLASPDINFNWEAIFIILFIAVSIDKSKMNPNRVNKNFINPVHPRNSFTPGATDWCSNPYAYGSPAYKIRNGYTN